MIEKHMYIYKHTNDICTHTHTKLSTGIRLNGIIIMVLSSSLNQMDTITHRDSLLLQVVWKFPFKKYQRP